MKRLVAIAVTAAMMLGVCLDARAQADSSSALAERTATELEALARKVMAVGQQPDEHPLAAAQTLLAEATKLAPRDAELWRLRVEAADLAGDKAELRAALGGYMKANPSDDAAQLRLIDLLVSDKDTAEERLATYGRLVEGKSAEALSGPLRSRVAARAALLARELNDQAAYTKWLKLAVSLDSTNRGAMGEIVTILDRKPNATAIERAQALVLLYRSDPTNAELRWQIADTLHRCGQYEQAVWWYGSAQRMSTMMGAGVTPAHRVGDWALCLWSAGLAKEGVGLIDSYQTAMTQQAAAQANAAGVEPPQAPVAIAPRLLTIRALLHRSMGNEEAYKMDGDAVLAIVDAEAAKDDATADEMVASIWARVLFRRPMDTVPGMIERAEKAGADAAVVARLRAWHAALSGDGAAAIKFAEPHTETDPLCAMAIVEALGDDEPTAERKTALLQGVYTAGPASLAARLATEQLTAMDKRPSVEPACATIGRIIAQTPQSMRDLGVDGASPLRLRIEPIQRTRKYGEPIEVRVEIVNAFGAPLSLGAGGTVPSTVLLAPTIRASADDKPAPMQPIVVDLGRRLVLQPNEAVSARVRLADPALLTLLRMRPDRTVRIEMSAVLNPRVAPNGVSPGLLGTTAASPPIARLSLAVTPERIDEQLATLEGDDPLAAATSATWLSLLAASIPADAAEDQAARADQIARQLHRAYQRFDTIQRAYFLSRLLKSTDEQSRLKPVIDMAVASEEPLVQYALLLTQVDSSTSTILESALRRKDTPEGRFASRVRSIWQTIEAIRKAAEEDSSDIGASDEPEK